MNDALSTALAAWRDWNGEGDAPTLPDLRWADLHEANLLGENLRGANLRWADLRGANLSVADLSVANLSGANLSGANLYGAKLREANLRGADLHGADLIGADLREADLSEANLYGAKLREANLRGADLHGANLSEADLREADLSGADLRGTCLDPLAPIPDATDRLVAVGFVIDADGYFTARRTLLSQHIGSSIYGPGEHVAPVFSRCTATDCHPGLYFLEPGDTTYDGSEMVTVRVHVGDVVAGPTKFRCRRFTVVS